MRTAWLAVGLLTAACATSASAEGPKGSSDLWVARPNAEAVLKAWPEQARKQGLGGRAAMSCVPATDGALTDCRVILDAPGGHGFGAALHGLAGEFRADMEHVEGERVVVHEDWHEIDTPPDWLKRPTARDLAAVFPREAMRRGKAGRSIISCLVTVQGALSDCIPIWESPADLGFGAAAVALTPQLAMKPARRNGEPVPSVANIPINFSFPGGPVSLQGSKRVAPAELPWIEAPSHADVLAAYPEKARANGIAGRATVQCDMTGAGRLRACAVIQETPKGRGFGAAARRLARDFRLEIKDEKTREIVGDLLVHLPFVFDPAMTSSAKPVIGKPSWAGLPSPEDMKAAVGRLQLTDTARAQLDCVVQPGGALDDCKVVSETPAGRGVGEAALSLTPKFRVTTWTAEGLPMVGGVLRIPLRFEP